MQPNQQQYAAQMAGIKSQREEITGQIEQEFPDRSKYDKLVYTPGRGWKPQQKPERLRFLESELKRLNEQEKDVSQTYLHWERASAEREERKEKRELVVEKRRSSKENLAYLRQKAASAGEGTREERAYLQARETHRKTFGSVADYEPIVFTGSRTAFTRGDDLRRTGTTEGVPYDVPQSSKVRPGFLGQLGLKPERPRTDFMLYEQHEYVKARGEMIKTASAETALKHKESLFLKQRGFMLPNGDVALKKSKMGGIESMGYRPLEDTLLSGEGVRYRKVDDSYSYYTAIENIKPKSKSEILVERMTTVPVATDIELRKEYPKGFAGKYLRAEEWTREKITYPIYAKAEKLTGMNIRQYSDVVADMSFATTPYYEKWFPKKTNVAKEFVSGYYSGYLTELKEYPVRFAGTTAVAFALPGALTGVSKILGKVGVPLFLADYLPGTTNLVSKAISYGLPAGYVTSVVARISMQETPRARGYKFGSIMAAEVTPMVIGGVAGAYTWPKVYGYFETIGRKKVPVEELVPKDVLYGSRDFPLANPRRHLSLFKEQEFALPGKATKYSGSRYDKGVWENVPVSKLPSNVPSPAAAGYHATAEHIRLTVGSGSSELPGLYVSHGVSPYFLRLNPDVNVYGASLNPYGSPKILDITPKGFKVGGVVGNPKIGYRWATNLDKGYAYVPGIKSEVEAIIPEGTKLSAISSNKFYTTWKNVRVPIDSFVVASSAKSGEFIVAGGNIESLAGSVLSYSLPTSYPLMTPAGFGSVLASSYKPKVSYSLSSVYSQFDYSYSSYSDYSISSYKPSYKSSSMVSSYKPSYKSSSMVSSAKSSAASRSLVSSAASSSYSLGYSSYLALPSSSGSSGGGSSYVNISSKLNPIISERGKAKIKPSKSFFSSKDFDSPFNPKYFASVEATLFNVRGKLPKDIRTGLNIRPIVRL